MMIQTQAVSRTVTMMLPLILPYLFSTLGWAGASRSIPTSLVPLHRQLLQEIKQSTTTPFQTQLPKDIYHPAGKEVRNTAAIISDSPKKDLLLSQDWTKLNETGADTAGIPLPRRGHSSTIRTIPPLNWGGNSVRKDDDHTVTSSNGNLTAPKDDGAMPHIDIPKEYMIISGGFTAKDWTTFPVWSYDITDAVLKGGGKWKQMNDVMIKEACTESHEIDNSKDLNDGDSWSNAVNCPPQSRYGHMSLVLNDYLYVFGGLLYYQQTGVFGMEDEPYIYRLNMSGPSSWQRIVARVEAPPSAEFLDVESENFVINRGEMRGGYWEEEDKMVIYGGLHVIDYNLHNDILRQEEVLNYTSLKSELHQDDITLGDVWTYDFERATWEMLAPLPSREQIISKQYPEARTSHAATVVGNELVICGGLKKVETLVWDRTTVWEQLTDVWIFDLNTRSWRERIMTQPIGRSHHSLVGWKDPEGDGDGPVIASFGGYRTIYDAMSSVPRPITYVYDDTLISFPPKRNHDWFAVAAKICDRPASRREHSAVLSGYGNMLIWGGRLETTEDEDIDGVWSLNVKHSLTFQARNDGDENQALEEFYLLVTIIFFISMMFTYMCGTLARQSSSDINDGMINPSDDFGFESSISPFGRSNGLGQDIIDTLPLKTYHNNNSISNYANREQGITPEILGQTSSNNNATINRVGRELNRDLNMDDEDEDCCPICLVMFKEGDEVRLLPCEHDFHKSCIDAWLGNNASCPACRYSLQNLACLSIDSSHPMSWTRISNLTLLGSNFEDDSESGTRQSNSPHHRVRVFSLMERFRSQGRRSHISASNSNVSAEGNTRPAHVSDNLAPAYSSSIELTEGMSSQPNLENRNDAQSMANDNSIHGQSHRVRVGNERQTRVRRAGRRRVGNARSPLNDPLQPPPTSATIV